MATRRGHYKKSATQKAKEALTQSGLSSQRLSEILKEAQENGGKVTVTRDGVTIDFGKGNAKAAPFEAPTAPQALTAADPGGPEPDAPKTLITPSDVESLREMERAQTLIDDPLQFEQDQVDGFLSREQAVGEGAVTQ